MSKVLVSIVSRQTIPNILFIKEMEEITTFLFVYTKEVEKELQNILSTTQIKRPVLLQVGAFDILAISRQLNTLSLSAEAEYIVNITGGTKLMSLAVYQHFVRFRHCSIYYMPIGENSYQQIYPQVTAKKDITFQLGVIPYLSAYGAKLTKQSFPIRKFKSTKEFALINCKKEQLSAIEKAILKKLGDLEKANQSTLIKEIKGLAAYLEYNHFKPVNDGSLQLEEIKYIRGGWLEAYLYFLFKKHLLLENHQILLNAIVPYGSTSNEFDILFTLNNRLHIIECKTGRRIRTEHYNNIVYKSGTIKVPFGINAKSYIFSLSHRMGEDMKRDAQIVDRAKQGQIVYVGRDIFDDETRLIQLIKDIPTNLD